MSDSLTPMMRQYRKVKAELPPNTILFFRLGDFYEMFFEDAIEASRILDIALTKRQKVPMCGVPYHAHESYLAKLIRAGKKVAVCDQMEDPAAAKGIVRREVTSVLTPGAVLTDQLLEAHRNNYLAGLYIAGDLYGLALLDLSTGVFWGEESRDADTLRDNLLRYAPTECVIPAGMAENPGAAGSSMASPDSLLRALISPNVPILVSPYDDWAFELETAYDTLVRHFGVQSLDGFGSEGHPAIIGAAGGVLHYVKNALHRNLDHVRQLRVKNPDDFLVMDEATRMNLDLVAIRGLPRIATEVPSLRNTSGTGQPAGITATLLGVLDVTKTAMGGRLLREWILRPLARLEDIRRRHDAVETFIAHRALLHSLQDTLAGIRDMERGIARLGAGSGNARDVRALGQSLVQLPAVREALVSLEAGQAVSLLAELAQAVTPLPDLVGLIDRAIVEEPPIPIMEGGIICRGYHAELDLLRDAAAQGKSWLAEYQAKEQQRTGIKTLKVRHNKVFGYYIEISKGQAANAPADYARKQTLVNAERFITPELKDYETKIFGAQDKAMALEYDLFLEIRDAVVRETARIQAAARAVAQLDVLTALADRALTLRYVRPVMTSGNVIRIRDSRHPVIEQIPGTDRFVPNDVLLDGGQNRLAIITGPNMAGKSTYIRQVALIVIMAQMGSYVPAAEAEIGLVDRVFTRVGAGDDLARGRSTFMVEMQETANILNNATPKSLIVLDEIGRGTSTFDGISIAWAVAEHLHGEVKAKTLFATHYHELTDLALTLPGVKNFNVLVREQGDRIVFLRKIVPGGTDKSYGIHVARLAGLPREVVDRAKEILLNLEEGEFGDAGQPKIAMRRIRRDKKDARQLSLFEREK
ncbi:MAG: DNA mismatch repair protein MutS [Verrucomicrobia bacterium]|nr:DNA mismatch repair protein MutS [Verrucomicrobiota bacterium]MBU4246948.1 DNA mismatch repair protein MutS [Verrucomicrobiota bacterium]MBU4291344.1 DNA mismatch repair protein MutS [Verrucomicrobiota bacterium]MBU4498079.1 DNA mismatch repair protein MutS [Verrucomicrobiota bacterium]MCG2680046.1 DNA mismatch repair protein MutS [Kiritimatiellia bacterium]